MDSDEFDNDLSFESESDLLNYFLFTNSYSIVHIYFDIKDRLSFSPFFLANLKSTDITTLLLDNLYGDKQPINKINTTKFSQLYSTELDISYRIINRFASLRSINIQYNNWIYFCYTMSDLYELDKEKGQLIH